VNWTVDKIRGLKKNEGGGGKITEGLRRGGGPKTCNLQKGELKSRPLKLIVGTGEEHHQKQKVRKKEGGSTWRGKGLGLEQCCTKTNVSPSYQGPFGRGRRQGCRARISDHRPFRKSTWKKNGPELQRVPIGGPCKSNVHRVLGEKMKSRRNKKRRSEEDNELKRKRKQESRRAHKKGKLHSWGTRGGVTTSENYN